MNLITVKTITPVVGMGLLLSFSGTADRIAFAPERGTTVTRTMENRMTIDLEDFTMDVDGQDMTAMMGGLPEMSMTFNTAVTVEDEFLEVGSRRPDRLKRTFNSISSNAIVDVSMMGEGESQETEMSSELEGATVIFAWDEEAGEFTKSFEDEEETRDVELLERLEEDMDLRAFLPRTEVSAGESWDIPYDALLSMVLPGGFLGNTPEGMDEMDSDIDMSQVEEMMNEMFEQYSDMAESLLDGERKATYQGMREIDGTNYAVITLMLDTDGAIDLSSMITDMLDRMSDVMDMPMEAEIAIAAADLSLTLEGSGELLWNPRTGIFASMAMETDMTMGMEISVDADMGGEATTLDMTMEMAGDMETSFTNE